MTVDMITSQQKLRDFILENYLFSDNEDDLKNDQSFLASGILDSMGVLELVGFLDDDFGVKVGPGEMTPENLDSIEKILDFINSKA